MRFRHRSGEVVHLAYCSNVHPAEDVDGVIDQLERFAVPVREALGWPRLGIGLWLAADAAAALAQDAGGRDRLRAALDAGGLEVVTLNGFPYGGFHDPVVKRAVYRPDWADPRRVAYTRDLAVVLAALLPDDVSDGSISTLPLGWRDWWDAEHTAAAAGAFADLARHLADLRERTGKRIRVALEPEPGCTVETVGQAVAALEATRADSAHIGVCLDCCHLAVQFEDPASALAVLDGADVAIVKSQVSSGLRVPDPAAALADGTLAAFDEPRFLHQTRARTDGGVAAVDDLPDAADRLPTDREWRVHFHVPVHAEGYDTTQDVLRATLDGLVGGDTPRTRHLEVETYTWTVLPPDRRPAGDEGLVEGLARELSWTADRLTDLGLQPLA